MFDQTSKYLAALILFAFVATGSMACGEMEELENQDQQNQQQNQDNDNDDNDNGDNGDNGEVDPSDHDIEVAGVWETNFDTEEVITDEQWDFRNMIDFDNGERQAITQNPESNDEEDETAGTYSRIVWTELDDDTFFYCEDVFGAETEEDARNADSAADESDLEEGCGEAGFGWTERTRQ